MELDTIKVKHDDGYMIINKADFDPRVHSLYDDPKAEGKKAEAKAAKEKKEAKAEGKKAEA